MATKKIAQKPSARRKNAAPTLDTPKLPELPETTTTDKFVALHDTLGEIRRAIGNRDVQTFRGRASFAQLETIIMLEALEELHLGLTDLENGL